MGGEEACKSEQTACMSDTTRGSIVSRDESKETTKECAANELCRKLMECHSPCFGKFVDCEANQACAAVLPNPEGDSEPSATEISKCASNPLCKEISKCKKIPFVTPKPTTTTTTTTTTTGEEACKSEQTACMSDTTCGGIVSRDESKGTDNKECAANELCRKLMECHSPCFGKFVDCEANQACAAVLPNPEGDSEPSAAEIRKCASNPLCKEILTCNKIPVPKPVKTCYSVGDPHFKTFAGAVFDSHNPGWKPMYSKGDLQIELNQLQFVKNRPVPNNGPAVNAAIKYTVDGGNNWETRTAGELLGPNKNQPELYFAQFDVKLKVVSRDYSRFAWAQQATFYDVWITTSEYDGAKGQCVEGKLRRLGESSGGVFFPANPKVTK